MRQEIIVAGFGGQGVLLLGQMLAYAGMLEGKYVTWLPSYGPEMRGGTANCNVVISDQEVGSPLVTEPEYLLALNRPSLDKFEPLLRPRGLLLLNSSLVDRDPVRKDLEVVAIPATQVAQKLGNQRIANMVMLGAFAACSRVVGQESVVQSLEKVLPARRHQLLPLNLEAIEHGARAVRDMAV